jgi:hypothetical protein
MEERYEVKRRGGVEMEVRAPSRSGKEVKSRNGN